MGYDGVADLKTSETHALRDLSGLIDINYFKRENGEMVIQTKNGVTLLDRDVHKLSHNSVAQASATTSYAGGGISGIYVDGVDITNQIAGGEIQGLIEIRDVTLPSLQSQLDELAGVLKTQINAIHNQGTAYPNTPSSLTGTRSFIDPNAQHISIENGDVRFIIFDSEGNQVATTNLNGGLGFTEGTVAEMTSASTTGCNHPTAPICRRPPRALTTTDIWLSTPATANTALPLWTRPVRPSAANRAASASSSTPTATALTTVLPKVSQASSD